LLGVGKPILQAEVAPEGHKQARSGGTGRPYCKTQRETTEYVKNKFYGENVVLITLLLPEVPGENNSSVSGCFLGDSH
jgi:hypothetical protein